jgi:hypothetical protein
MASAQAKLDEQRWLRGLGDRVVQSAIPKGEKEDPWAKARLDALFAKFTAPALSEPEFVEQTLELQPRAAVVEGATARLIAPDCRAAAVYRLRGTKTLVVVTAVQMGCSAYELRMHVRAPRNRTYYDPKYNDALVHARMTPEGSRRLLAQLVHVPAMRDQDHVGVGSDDLSINRHHPHVLSVLTRMSELDKLLVQEAREHNPLLIPSDRTIDSRLVLVAFSPLPAGAEEVLCLVGHSAAFTRGDTSSVATPPWRNVDQLCDVLGRDYVKECGLVPTPACAKLICERASLFSPTTGRNGVFDRLANFDVLIEAGEEERDVRRLVAEMGIARAGAPADAHGACPPSAPSPTPSSVDDDEPRIAPPVIPSNQGKRPSNGAASGKTKAAAKKRARERERERDEHEDESDDEEEEESEEEDVSDGGGEDAPEEDEDEGSDEDESEEPAPPPKKAKAAPAAAAAAAAAARSPAAPLVFACPDGVREVHTDCIHLKNVQMLAHIPVAINAPEGATEAKVVVQYYARVNNGHARGA